MNDLRFAVDFNDRDREGHLKASMRFASPTGRVPGPGETVWTADDDGHICQGTVIRAEGNLVYIDLDRSTWRVLGPPVAAETSSIQGTNGVRLDDIAERSVLVPAA